MTDPSRVEKGPAFPQPIGDPGPSSQPSGFPQPQPGPMSPHHAVTRIGDPGALALFSFASTTIILSLYNLQTRAVTHPNIVIGMAIFCGGIAMILAGMWAFPRGDSFGGTVYTSYGAFWLAYASLLIPGTGILASYAFESEFRSAFGIFLLIWGFVSFFLFLVGCFLKNWGLATFLFFLAVTFWVWCGGVFQANIGAIKAAGVLGCISAFIAYFCGFLRLLESTDHAVTTLQGYY